MRHANDVESTRPAPAGAQYEIAVTADDVCLLVELTRGWAIR
jgi:hypothetical protein